MEQTCRPGRIQISKETAENLAQLDKQNWIEKRADIVEAKGKGKIETWWLVHMENGATKEAHEGAETTGTGALQGSAIHICPEADPKIRRLITWNVECLLRLLKEVVARRNAGTANATSNPRPSLAPSEEKLKKGETFLDEVKEIIALPRFDEKVVDIQQDVDEIVLPEEVVEELTDYVTVIASMYRCVSEPRSDSPYLSSPCIV